MNKEKKIRMSFMKGDTLSRIIGLCCCALLVLIVPACIKTYKLVPSESSQGAEDKVACDKNSVVKNNVRSVKVYEEWQTDAMFDVLWVSDDTSHYCADLYCSRRGKSETERKQILQKDLNKNLRTIRFYVLADVRDGFNKSLAEKNPSWVIYLESEVDGKKVRMRPTSIKEVEELTPEVLSLFGYRYDKPKFKTPYLVEFSAADKSGRIFIEKQKPFKMVLTSTRNRCLMGWQGGHPVKVERVHGACKKNGKFINEDYYWV